MTITVLEGEKRPVAAVADHVEVRHVREVEIAEDQTKSATHPVRPRPQPGRARAQGAVQVLSRLAETLRHAHPGRRALAARARSRSALRRLAMRRTRSAAKRPT